MTIYAITDRVLEYINHGFAPIPIEFASKKPIVSGWPELAISEVNIGDYFNGNPANIGVLMGKPSGGLVDVDIDNTEALRLADWFLPRTNCVFGRASKPRSHRIYRASDAARRETFDANGMIAEIRGNKHYTLFPGSVHPSGESIEFDNPIDFTPGSSTWRDLTKAVQKMAIGTLLQQQWCPGRRHRLALSTTAFLVREGWNREDFTNLIEAVATEGHDEELNDRLLCVESTFEKHGSGRAISNDESFMDLVGSDIVQKIKRWSSGEKYNVTVSDLGRLEQIADLSSDASAADAFAAVYRDRIIYSNASWYRKTVQIFEPIPDALVQGLAKDFTQIQTASYGASLMVKGCLTRARINATVELSRSRFHVDPKLIDAEPDLIGSADGTILNLTRGDGQMSKAAFITKRLGASTRTNSSCPRWLAFLNRIFDEDRELIAFLQRAVGYTLTGSCEEQCLFILIGSGANGKSTFLNTLQALFGDYAASVPMQSLMEQEYGSQQTNDLAHLLGQRLVTASEGEPGQKLAESKVKLMTGGDVLSCRYLYRDLFDYKPQFKLWLATNNLPTITGTDEAIWRRIRVIPFSITIPPAEQDKTLTTRLAAELPGILNWAFEGWKLWKKGGLKPPDRVVQSTGNYRTDNDSVGQWIDAACVKEPWLRTSMKTLHESYHSWCENSGFEPLTSSCLGKELGHHGFDLVRTSTGNGRRGIRIKLSSSMASNP